MRLSTFLTLTLTIVSVKADLTCLAWDVFVPIIGLVCHFKPKVYKAADAATVKGVEDAAASIKDLVQFDLTHNPAVVLYDYTSLSFKKGPAASYALIANDVMATYNVTIGVAKETSNQVVQLYELSQWNQISFCLMMGAAQLLTSPTNKRPLHRRAGLPATSDVQTMASNCLRNEVTEHMKFNITDPNQRVGATISDLASFFVPVGAEEKAGEVAKGAFDLAIPGSEDTTRIFKKVARENVAQHFADEQEARAVADGLQDPKWSEDACAVCPLPAEAIVARDVAPTHPYLGRRGIVSSRVFGACCGLPSTNVFPGPDAGPPPQPGAPSTVEQGSTLPEVVESTEHPQGEPIIDRTGKWDWTEEDLTPPPAFVARDINIPADADALRQDLVESGSSLVAWSPELIKVSSSDSMLGALRTVFTGPTTDPLYKALKITRRDGGLRMMSNSESWIKSTDPALRIWQDFVKASADHCIDVVTKTKKITDPKRRANLRGLVEFFWTAPSKAALVGTDPRGFHVGRGLMQFAVSDVPGLVVANTAEHTASRVVPRPNAFYCLKATKWDTSSFLRGMNKGATLHSVFGPEMSAKGRVSMVLSVIEVLG